MDFNSLKDQVSNLTLYDLKAGVRKVQNAVMNYTEMEAKVREATNNEPWGASSTLMQEIANATYSHQLLNEIMPMIYKRFTEKAAEEWRQIYKGLQLLEFLIKNGSERVIDDARSHLFLLKMLRQFHFIDMNGKDQGVNVRNRAKELAELLSDVDRIRAERKKARANRNKFGGVEGGSMGGGMSSGSRYGGFGSEDAGGYGGYSGGVYGDGGGFGGNTSGFQDSSSRKDRFEEYDEYDEGDGAGSTPARRKPDHSSAPSSSRRETVKAEKPKAKEPEVDLFSFGDDEVASAPALAGPSNGKSSSGNARDDAFGTLQAAGAEDDFDDFQSATPVTQPPSKPSIQGLPPPTATSTTNSTTQYAAPRPVSGIQGANLNDLVGFSSISPAPSTNTINSSTTTKTTTKSNTFSLPPTLMPIAQQQQPKQQPPRPTGYQAPQPNYFTSVPAPQPQPQSQQTSKPNLSSAKSYTQPTSNSKQSSSTSGGDAFGSLWSSASAGAGIKKSGTPTNASPNLASMAKEKASAGIWGAAGTSTQNQRPVQGQGQKVGGGLDDLLG